MESHFLGLAPLILLIVFMLFFVEFNWKELFAVLAVILVIIYLIVTIVGLVWFLDEEFFKEAQAQIATIEASVPLTLENCQTTLEAYKNNCICK